MSKLIELDKVLELIEQYNINNQGFFIDRVKNLPEASQWIDVKDRLPETSGLVEICLAETQDIYIAHFKKSRNLFQVWGAGRDPIIDMKTTHWKPMPKPSMHVCRELDCGKMATKEEYPENGYYVCDSCYERLHPPIK